jgi:hypothetical protein
VLYRKRGKSVGGANIQAYRVLALT